MTPPLFLIGDLGSGETLVLTGPEAHHAAIVKRLSVGEAVLLADGVGGIAETVVQDVGRDRVSFRVLSRMTVPEPTPRFVVVQALPKGERAELAVELLTELGADEIVPWEAARSISRWRGEKSAKGVGKWRRTAVEASKQSRRPRIPVVADLVDTATVVRLIEAAALALVLHEEAIEALAAMAPAERGDVVLIVGPEGGLSPDELRQFTDAGARPVRLGAEVLRTSTAGAAALAVLSARAGRWR
jgi:16S rRNA (uracil1498-N3)-methyltransferase